MIWLATPLGFVALTALLALLAFFDSVVYIGIALLIWWSFGKTASWPRLSEHFVHVGDDVTRTM